MQEAFTPVALIYTRVSRDDPEHLSVGLASQRAICERYAADRGWRVALILEDVMTGARDDRAGYQRLLQTVRDSRRNGIPAVVVV